MAAASPQREPLRRGRQGLASRFGVPPAFDDFVGTAGDDSDLYLHTLEPTRESWADGDREVLCAIGTADGSKLEGTAEGSRR